MRLPSVEEVLRSAGGTFARFPFVILDAFIGAGAALVIVDYDGPPVASPLVRIVFAALLGIPFLAAVVLTGEKRGWGKGASFAAQAVVAVLLVAYAFTVPLDMDRAPGLHYARLVMLVAAVLFLATVLPYAGRGGRAGHWQYNKMLAFRLLTAGVFAAALFGGLAVALAALDNLFGVDVVPKRYGELWVIVAGIFTPWFFLAGIPERLDDLDGATDYPKVVKIFAQYILLPLVLVYAVILYAYAAKILVEWSWPRGWVSGLILGYGSAGLLTSLLLHPLREMADHPWIRKTSLWFFVSLVPLVPMLVLAVMRRVSEYGLTEGRYLALVVGVWFGLISLYFIFARAKDIRAVPASLCLVGLLAAFGPLSAFSVSESSQVERLRAMLERQGMLADGRIVKPTNAVPLADRRQVSSILSYLHEMHGFERIQPWFGESLREDSAGPGTRYKSPADVARLMGFEYVTEWVSETQSMVTFDASRTGSIPVAGFDGLLRSRQIFRGGPSAEYASEGIRYHASAELDTLTVVGLSAGVPVDSVKIALRPFVDSLLTRYANMSAHEVDQERLSLAGSGSEMSVRVYFPRMSVEKTDRGPKLLSYEAEILYSLLHGR